MGNEHPLSSNSHLSPADAAAAELRDYFSSAEYLDALQTQLSASTRDNLPERLAAQTLLEQLAARALLDYQLAHPEPIVGHAAALAALTGELAA